MINKDVVIVYNKFLCPYGLTRVLGGIETYLHYLALLLARNISGKVTIIQPADTEFQTKVDNYVVLGKVFSSKHKKVVCDYALNYAKKNQSILIFAADQYSIKTNYKYAISIMHGVSWDLPAKFFTGNGGIAGLLGHLPYIGDYCAKKYVIWQRLCDIQNSNTNVLVDYNSINWYRTQFTSDIPFDYKVILNFANQPEKQIDLQRHLQTDIKIVFARRFQTYRGVDLMIATVQQLLIQYPNVSFCFAGEGPEEGRLRSLFANESRVEITKYNSENSVDFHSDFHIAVVPSLASEGSSLSVAEAMLAGCVVIATDVGGITNMILNDYNGVLIKPNAKSLLDAVSELIVNRNKRISLASNSYLTSREVFSNEKWGIQWLDLINEVITK